MKPVSSLLLAAMCAVASVPVITPAWAQKSADTIRLAVNNPFVILSQYHLPLDETSIFYTRVFQSLIAYDEHERKWVPQLEGGRP